MQEAYELQKTKRPLWIKIKGQPTYVFSPSEDPFTDWRSMIEVYTKSFIDPISSWQKYKDYRFAVYF
jgi:hypothetical protein